jgi:excisionase family DNA binding protein
LASRIKRKPDSHCNSEPEPEIQPIALPPLGRHKHVEKFLDVSENKVNQLIREEGLPVIRLGGTVRFDMEAVRAWALRRQLQTTKSEERAG